MLLRHAESVFELIAISSSKSIRWAGGKKDCCALAPVRPLRNILWHHSWQIRNKFPDVQLSLVTGNTEQVEKSLLAKETEIGIIEGYSKNPEISYHEFLKDEIVLACSSKHPLANQKLVEAWRVKKYPFCIKGTRSGTLEVIDHALKEAGINHAALNKWRSAWVIQKV